MNRQRYIVFILFLLFSLTSLQARRTELILQKAADDRYVPAIPVYLINEYQYISLQDLLDSYKVSAFLNPAVRKTVFRLGRLKFKVTAYNHYIMVEDKTFQMSHAVIFFEGKTYLPMDDFVGILKLVGLVSGVTILSGSDPADLQVQKEAEPMEFSPYDIMSAKIEERQNGTVIRIRTANRYDARSVKAWINRDEWLYVTLPSAKVNKPGLDNTKVPKNSSVRTVTADQLDGTSQLTFRLRGTVEGVDVLHRDSPPEILLTIRRPFVIDQSHYLEKERQKWKLDKVVLDAGHGGHDPGARGNGLKEKDITLDVVKRLGKLIETRTDIEVIYTRDTDVFVPLWERTKIANEAGGKVFLSIHVNANKNKRASGFETYLLRPGKTDAAIAVAEMENAVIKLEKNVDQYNKLSAEQLILATMAQSSFMQQSETLADLTQSEFDKKLVGQNRGVKQAGFIVLIGASMPNVLIELGFISNKNDARRLKQSAYRQKAAQGIFDALMKYKTRHEKLLSP
ncbi:MAG: N-acetylmuramoyl-L-alanine amidase [Candidatus Marinimicrobia bacterium]|jgi:N-acetylmuramoyl-L-alanine amidase|nr:N-acetylmuramoyl-L-alanine amidase [Candidatus Neomarinimicrobiota bacterium]MBT4421195.1 N-acetylmuramoyl-L-alanine amidase [Candidatus Neomarinimicrobiota bacterium]MBT6003103.1 N-acetylmuramoyl-L-alanine amidase [Candidatus Neomarinimicrobiota bacterium]MBT6759141.1 N-acetylmuramoyl-L-alanine amidase [Candidatus Neomarinimicrobiota bacterium]MBT7198982.1 N-acetylmuramoyl-L-alanine amidase [Candidatus Neomarinimicrobiota bacterium]